MIRRTMEVGAINALANHPEIRPYVAAGSEPLDLTPVVLNPSNYILEAYGGCWVLQALAPGSYEVHTLFLREARGKAFSRQVKEAIRWMFVRTDAVEILTKCPDDNPGARMAAIMCGFKERFRREEAWHTGVGISYMALTLDLWAQADAQARGAGEKFHRLLEGAKSAAGSALPTHPDDAAHDHAAGAAFLMAQAGNIEKAVVYYSRWAVFAGYAPIAQVGPNTIDLGDAVVEARDGEMVVLLTR